MDTSRFDFLVIGSGLAGLTFALQASKHGSVCVLTKADLSESNTTYAQGGIAAAVGEADNWELHEEDTLAAGAGLNDRQAVRFLVREAPAAIEWLMEQGARFDLEEGGDLALGREGGHSRNRILHYADRTGWEIERSVTQATRKQSSIRVIEHAFATHLLQSSQRIVGVQAEIDGLGTRQFLARATFLATGGCGRLYQHTTNPRVATGDGIALASKVGCAVNGMEFMQFHPTTLYHPQMRSFLITEAVRGEGATLRNHNGRRFMYDYDPRLELAPRDVVSRAIDAEIKRLSTWCVYLDMTHLDPTRSQRHFPTIWEQLRKIDLELEKDWIPVVPAQHYSCGGIVTDLDGRTSIPGLYAAGEVAHTGVHGANRLASNSLLEALVFAKAAAAAAINEPEPGLPDPVSPVRAIPEEDAVQLRRSLQRSMTANVGIVRSFQGMEAARQHLNELEDDYARLPEAPFARYPIETTNLFGVARHVIESAIARRENVGLHFNEDLA
jgi:L-aspartate oxidase